MGSGEDFIQQAEEVFIRVDMVGGGEQCKKSVINTIEPKDSLMGKRGIWDVIVSKGVIIGN